MHVFVVTPLVAACAASGHLVWMLVLFFVGFWPFPFRARWTPEGLEISWLFVRETLRVADIESARLRTNFRYLLLVRYEVVLEIELTGNRRATLVASPRSVEMLHSELRTALALHQKRLESDTTL